MDQLIDLRERVSMGISGGRAAQTSCSSCKKQLFPVNGEIEQAAPSRALRSGLKVSRMVPQLMHSPSLQRGHCWFTSGQPHFPANIRTHAESQEVSVPF